MKRIGIDARLYFQTGVGVYLRNFFHFLQQNPPTGYEFYIYVLKKDEYQISFNSSQFIKREVHSHWHSFSEQTAFLQKLNQDKLDLMHFTYFSYPVLYKRKFIATVHDITPLIHKTGRASTLHPLLYELKYQSFKFVLQQQVKNARIIITPTKAVKNQLLDVYGKKYETKIMPIYEGINYEMEQAQENISLKSKFKKPFFVYIGNFYPHKNVETLIRAFQHIPSEYELVLVGPDSYFAGRVQKELYEKKITNIRFYHTGSIEDLVFFYKNAIALINPSISEGFGLPLVEAAYFKLPVIASDLKVFHEIVGDSFISFDPQSVEQLKTILLHVIQKKQQLIKPTINKQISFKQMTSAIVNLYHNELKAI
ncbi:MAG TPA: glycosyltransferase family 1 protein [Candidatus Woesebacteria bacterium]|nr:glycosyltransferase family 1 protein [Candidatus Woesebacteria bacterium]